MRKFVLFALLFVLLSSCGSTIASVNTSDISAPTWQEQYDLGLRYLSEGNYQEAILAFKAAIAIDPKQSNAYLHLAEAYQEINDLVQAKSTLEAGYTETQDAALRKMLDEINGANETADKANTNGDEHNREVYDENGNLVRRNYYDADGKLSSYQLISVDEETGYNRSDNYNGDGVFTGHVLYYESEDSLMFYSEYFDINGQSRGLSVRAMSPDGKWLYSASIDKNGNEISRSVAQYDEDGKSIGWNNYDKSGVLTGYARYEAGRTNYYDANGNLTKYSG